jgi:hypothetical protein
MQAWKFEAGAAVVAAAVVPAPVAGLLVPVELGWLPQAASARASAPTSAIARAVFATIPPERRKVFSSLIVRTINLPFGRRRSHKKTRADPATIS